MRFNFACACVLAAGGAEECLGLLQARGPQRASHFVLVWWEASHSCTAGVHALQLLLAARRDKQVWPCSLPQNQVEICLLTWL